MLPKWRLMFTSQPSRPRLTVATRLFLSFKPSSSTYMFMRLPNLGSGIVSIFVDPGMGSQLFSFEDKAVRSITNLSDLLLSGYKGRGSLDHIRRLSSSYWSAFGD